MLFSQFRQYCLRWIVSSLALSLLVSAHNVYAAGLKPTYTPIQKHGKSSGGTGKDPFILKKTPSVSGAGCPVFAGASVDYKKRRLGEAKILSKPAKGCNPAKGMCKLTVSWKHAPTGSLNYRLKIDWKLQPSGC